jgi:hypothetical protein
MDYYNNKIKRRNSMCFSDEELDPPEAKGFQVQIDEDDLDPVEIEKHAAELVEQYELEHETHCWGRGCGTIIIKSQCRIDPPYGYICPNPNCGRSHRYHHLLGMGKDYDRATPLNYEKYQQYKQHKHAGR